MYLRTIISTFPIFAEKVLIPSCGHSIEESLRDSHGNKIAHFFPFILENGELVSPKINLETKSVSKDGKPYSFFWDTINDNPDTSKLRQEDLFITKKGLIFRLKDESLLYVNWPKRSINVKGIDILTKAVLDKLLPIIWDMSENGMKKINGRVDLINEGYKGLFLISGLMTKITLLLVVACTPAIFLMNLIYGLILSLLVRPLGRFLEVYLTKEQSKRLSAVAVIIGMILNGVFMPYMIKIHSLILLVQFLFIACVLLLLLIWQSKYEKKQIMVN